MDIKKDKCSIAVVQAAPVMFDSGACTDKALSLIAGCADNGAELIVFPELFIPGYPYGMTYGFTVGSRSDAGREDWKDYLQTAMNSQRSPKRRRKRTYTSASDILKEIR